MLLSAVFTFLLSAVNVAVGTIPLYPSFSSISDDGQIMMQDPFVVDSPLEPGWKHFGFGVKVKTLPFLENPIVSTKPNDLPFSEGSRQKCRKEPQIIERFANNFIGRVMACNKLREAFDVRQFNAKSLSSFYYNYVFQAHSAVGALDAPVSAQIASDAVAVNFGKLKEDDVLRIYAYATASYLFYRGYLNPSNVESLSQTYFTFTERYVNSVKNPAPEANIKAVADAFTYFLSSLGLVNPYSTVMICGLFSSQWYQV